MDTLRAASPHSHRVASISRQTPAQSPTTPSATTLRRQSNKFEWVQEAITAALNQTIKEGELDVAAEILGKLAPDELAKHTPAAL